MAKYQRPKGTHDLYPGAPSWEDDSVRVNMLEDKFRKICQKYGYGEIRTPVFEPTELFTRAIGEGTDIVSKEMYTFIDKGDRSMTLRPEGTAPAIRAYLDSNLMSLGGVAKLYYSGPIFRYERPQKGRFRQHQQLGIEALGSDDPALDAEVIQMALEFFGAIGIQNLTLKINSVGSVESRGNYLVALKEYVSQYLSEFSDEGKMRFEHNPLRMLDTKNEREIAILQSAPKLSDYLTEDEQVHMSAVRGYLDDNGVAYSLDPYLVRGFDYYTKTAFEIQSPDLGAQNAVGGGGRYNTLVQQLGGKPTSGIGFGLGVERALIALQELNVDMMLPGGPDIYILTKSESVRPLAVKKLKEFRALGISADMDYQKRAYSAQFNTAKQLKAKYILSLEDETAAEGKASLRSLSSDYNEVHLLEGIAQSFRELVQQP